MSCWWMRNLILDTNTKEIQIQVVGTPAADLHVTSNRYDHYKDITDFGNRHWFSDGANAATIVPAPDINQCWKREVTSISVYNPNDVPEMFYIIEYDDDTWTTTVIDEKLLNPFESWTLECICNCCNGCGVNVYDEWTLVYSNAYNLNFIGSCVNAARNNLTGMVDITVNPTLAFDTWTNILSLCWWSVDLSSLAWGWSINVYDSWDPIHATTAINFIDCLTATRNTWTSMVDVGIDLNLTYTPLTQTLSACWDSVIINEANISGYVDMAYASPSLTNLINWFMELDNTPEIRLPVIPLTHLGLLGRRIVIYNKTWSTAPAVVTPLASVTLNWLTHSIAVGETVEYIIRDVGTTTTEYNRIS